MIVFSSLSESEGFDSYYHEDGYTYTAHRLRSDIPTKRFASHAVNIGTQSRRAELLQDIVQFT